MAATSINVTPYTPVNGQDYNGDITIQIRKADFNNVAFQDGKLTLVFSSCMFKKITLENTEEIDFPDISLNFIGCYIQDIDIENITTKNLSLGFNRSIISGRITDLNLKSVSISDSIIRSNIFVTDVEKVHVSFYEGNLVPERWAELADKLGGFTIEKAGAEKQSYHIHNSKNIHITSTFKADRRREFKNVNLSINYNLDIEDKVTNISNVYLKSLSITGTSSGRISVENVKIQDWYIYDFLPKEQVGFFNITPIKEAVSGKIGIHKCNLDNTWFDNVSFSRYEIVSFYRSKFSKTSFTSCNFPDNYEQFKRFMSIENVHYPDKKEENYPKDVYETILQLKLALEGSGNYFESQKLQAVAHDALKEIKDIPLQDKLILAISNLSNNHGLSISRPFWWFIAWSVFFYILYLLSLGRIFNCNGFDGKLIGYYFSFIDLTHRTDFLVQKEEYNGWSLFFDYANKVIVGFFIYQFIASFRKYGKK